MILKLLLNLFLELLQMLFILVDIPEVPDSINAIIDFVFQYMQMGFGFVCLVVDWTVIQLLLPIVLVVANFDRVYGIVMWILRKIPMLGIE